MKFTIRFLSTFFLSLLAVVPVRSQTVVSLPSNDIAYDAVAQMIYASVPSTGPVGRANTITPINPATGVLGTSIAVGVNPNRLAVSDDGQFLYAGLLGSPRSAASRSRPRRSACRSPFRPRFTATCLPGKSRCCRAIPAPSRLSEPAGCVAEPTLPGGWPRDLGDFPPAEARPDQA